MHHLTAERLLVGQYHTLMHKLRQDDGTKFFEYFRMSQETFDQLLHILKPHIEKQDTTFRRSKYKINKVVLKKDAFINV